MCDQFRQSDYDFSLCFLLSNVASIGRNAPHRSKERARKNTVTNKIATFAASKRSRKGRLDPSKYEDA
jgi:hypothetical protein